MKKKKEISSWLRSLVKAVKFAIVSSTTLSLANGNIAVTVGIGTLLYGLLDVILHFGKKQ